jgi:hypothetical protein
MRFLTRIGLAQGSLFRSGPRIARSSAGRPPPWRGVEGSLIKREPDPSATRVQSVADIDALITDTAAVLVVRLDDRKLGALSRLNALRRLYREGGSQVTDEGLCYLVSFPLEVLDLGESPQITDRGLAELRLIRGLRWLDVTGCPQLTEAGLQALQAALPQCVIVA